MRDEDRTNLNVLAGIAAISSTLLINLMVAPLLVGRLGPEAFGFVGLINNLVSTTTILSFSLNLMAARYVSLAIHRGDVEEARIYFNSALGFNGFLSLLYIAAFAPAIIYADRLFSVSEELVWDVRVALSVVLLSFVLSSMFNIFGVGSIAYNRLDLVSLRDVLANAVRLAIIIGLFLTQAASVRLVGFGYLGAAVTASAINILLYKKLLSSLRLGPGYFRLGAGWVLSAAGASFLFNAIGGFLMGDASVLLANLTLGGHEMGLVAIARTVPVNLLVVAGVVAGTFAPVFIKDFGLGRLDSAAAVLDRALQTVTTLVAVPLAGFIAFGHDFFRLWLPSLSSEQVSAVYVLAVVISLGVVGDALTSPLFPLLMAAGRLGGLAAWSLSLGVLNLALLLTLAYLGHASLFAIVLVGAVLTSFKVLVVLPLYGARVLSVDLSSIILGLFKHITFFALLVGLFALVSAWVRVENWGVLVTLCVVSGGFGYLLIFSASDRFADACIPRWWR